MLPSRKVSSQESKGVNMAVGPGGLPTYLVSDRDLAHASSLGRSSCWVTTKSTGAIETVSSLDLGHNVIGSCLLEYCGVDLRVVGPQRGPTAGGEQSQKWFDGGCWPTKACDSPPWESPRLLWAAIEGMLGVIYSVDGCVVQPPVPDGWKWLAVRRLPHVGREETMFLARQEGKLHLYGSASVVAPSREDELLICLGSSAEGTITRRST
jgi:hypothetical protein